MGAERSDRLAGTAHLPGAWKGSRERRPSALAGAGPAQILLIGWSPFKSGKPTCSPSKRTRITRELARNADSQAPLRPSESESVFYF